jgi:ketosteroid isomerase-like protein
MNGTNDRREQAREAVRRHVELWNTQDKDGWLGLFAADVRYEDPPGTVSSQGRQVMSDYAWDKSFTDTKRWILEAVLVIACGHEAVVHMRNHGSVDGKPAWTDSIEVWSVNGDGLVDSVRAFWEPSSYPSIEASLAVTDWVQRGTATG